MTRSSMHGGAWLSVLCAPLSMAMAAAFCTGLALLHDVARVLRRAEVVRQQVARTAAELVAETALADDLAARGKVASHLDGTFTSCVERTPAGWLVRVRGSDGERWFASDQLAGGAPALLGGSQAIGVAAGGEGVGARLGLDTVALARAQRAEQSPLFVRDNGIALLHLRVGTDREDFTLGCGASRVALTGLEELVVVPGHLWIPPDQTPLLVAVQRDTVLVVQGNVYLGRPLRVQGGGRLLLVTTVVDGACAFADADGDGRWSPGDRLCGAVGFRGPIEGSGGVWIGGAGAPTRVDVGIGLVVEGEVMLDRPASVSGPLIAGYGITATRSGATLAAGRSWTFRPDRDRVPGFTPVGAARPGRMRFVGAERPGAPGVEDRNHSLYLAAPTR